MRVKKGDRLFNMPARELEMFVSAYVKRNAGIRFPINPDKAKDFAFWGVNFFKLLMANGSNIMNPKKILIAAT